MGTLTRILLFGFLPIFFQLVFALILVTNFFGVEFFPLVLGICLTAGYITYAMNSGIAAYRPVCWKAMIKSVSKQSIA